jgi:hypothetical protein
VFESNVGDEMKAADGKLDVCCEYVHTAFGAVQLLILLHRVDGYQCVVGMQFTDGE